MTCKNLDYGKDKIVNRFECKLFGAHTLNKNVKYANSYIISCKSPLNQQNAKGRCVMTYFFEDSDSLDEADDVENPDKI